jgi:nitroimidazol reductase NimA-like FMN-containing flavoprotein (pyridoxamine 5'-phosphate oxidase superfamily)
VSYPKNGLTVLSEQACRELLEIARIGRVLVSMDAMPAALPVNFRVVAGEIAFRTAPGSKLSAAVDHTVLGFEVDDFDEQRRSGWSVLVVGTSRVATEPDEIAELDRAGLDSWWMAPSARYVLIEIQRISGRRIEPPTRPTGA